MNIQDLDNRKFIELLQMLAGDDKVGFKTVFREAARRLNAYEVKIQRLGKSNEQEG